MQFSIKRQIKNRNAMLKIIVVTFLTALGCFFFGYLLLPFAAAFYAALLTYEKNSKFIFSYIIPIIVLISTVILAIEGIVSIECITALACGALIYEFCQCGVSKGESAFWLSFLIFSSFILAAFLLGITFVSGNDGSSMFDFYVSIYENIKTEITKYLSSLVIVDKNGLPLFAYTPIEAEILFSEILILAVPIVTLIAFLLCGISLKLYSALIVRYSGEDCGINSWMFSTSNFIAYFYLAVAILAVFTAGESNMFGYLIMSLDLIFAPIFAYVGTTLLYAVIKSYGKSSGFAIIAIALSLILFSNFAYKLLSFIGVYFTISTNKQAEIKK